MLIIFFAVLLWSGINPHDYRVWALEVVPGVIALLVFGLTYKKMRFTDIVYFVIFVHCLILFVGGHYTYAKVPLFDYIKEMFETGRNSYDKIGHFAQGFTPVLVAREFLIRRKIMTNGTWSSVAAVSFALAFSAVYEIIEWLVALTTHTVADDFLGTQGYVWDTQADMFWALIGGLTMVIIFKGIHDKAIEKIETN